MNISLDRYRTFWVVAQSASLSKASEQLGISQPAVSQSIALLEKQLGCQLFLRSPRGVTLTREGSALLPFISHAMTMIQQAQRHFDELRSLSQGTLRIGASDTLCKHWLLPHLSAFHAAHPDIAIQVTNRTSGETLSLLEQGQVDLGLVHLPLVTPKEYALYPMLEIHDCFLFSPDYFPELRSEVSMEQLSRLPLILLEQCSASRRFLDDAFAGQGVILHPEIELGSLDLMMDFARAGLGVCAGVVEFSHPAVHSGLLQRLTLTPALPPRSIALLHPLDTPLSYAAVAFRDYVLSSSSDKEGIHAANPAP